MTQPSALIGAAGIAPNPPLVGNVSIANQSPIIQMPVNTISLIEQSILTGIQVTNGTHPEITQDVQLGLTFFELARQLIISIRNQHQKK